MNATCMRWVVPVLVGLLAVAAGLLPSLEAQGNGLSPFVVAPPHTKVDGLSYGEWNARWWQWAVSFPYDPQHPELNPVTDPDGSAAALGQSGPVWFLAGTYGANPVTRNVTIPAGKKLLVAIMNQEWDNLFGFDPLGYTAGNMSIQQLRRVCDYIIDRAANLSLTVDGVPINHLKNFRCPSPVFEMTLEPSLAAWWGYPTTPVYPCVADGIYVILQPLTPGPHTIHIHSENTYYGSWFAVDVTYNLTIL